MFFLVAIKSSSKFLPSFITNKKSDITHLSQKNKDSVIAQGIHEKGYPYLHKNYHQKSTIHGLVKIYIPFVPWRSYV